MVVKVTLHHCHETRSMRTLWLLEELGVDYTLVVHPFDKSLRTPEFLAKSPAGRVPALEFGDQVLFETGAIAEILCERFPQAGLGRAPDHPERADFLVWLHFAETITALCVNLTQQHIMLREDWMRSPVLTKLEAARLGKTYDGIEARLTGRDHLLDGGFSAADIAVAQAVYLGERFARIGDRKNLAEWMNRLRARPGFQASLPPEGEALYSRDFYEPLPNPA